MRAQLIAQESQADGTSASGGYAYESPLIEQGTVLLGGTKMEFGFALRQQFFHKSVMLLLQHDESFTKGIILNRPSALEVEGWRLWCGHGQVAEGGLFVGAAAAKGELEINALHSLDHPRADELSTRVIKGVSYTSLEGAKELVAAGIAAKGDFWVCAGYSGWAPGQLQMECDDRGSWCLTLPLAAHLALARPRLTLLASRYMASADSGTLLKELLQQASALPPPSEGAAAVGDNGISTCGPLSCAASVERRTCSSRRGRSRTECWRIGCGPPHAAAPAPPGPGAGPSTASRRRCRVRRVHT